jgi:hypothetical protein
MPRAIAIPAEPHMAKKVAFLIFIVFIICCLIN